MTNWHKNLPYFSFCLPKLLVQRTLNFTQLFETSICSAHLLKFLHNIDIVGNESGPETFSDGFVPIKGRIISDSLLPLNDIFLNNLNLF